MKIAVYFFVAFGFLWMLSEVSSQLLTKNGFEFRGYGTGSSCQEVIRAEDSLGAEKIKEWTYEFAPNDPIVAFRFQASIFKTPVVLDIACLQDGRLFGATYTATVDSRVDAEKLYNRFQSKLKSEYGSPTIGQVDGFRYSRFRCDEKGQLSIGESDKSRFSDKYSVAIYVQVGPVYCGVT